MKLTFEQLKSITKGALVIRENADGSVNLDRMTDAQKAPYPTELPKHRFPCDYSANILFDFYTDADSVTVTVAGRRKKKNASTVVDLLLDGAPARSAAILFPTEDSDEETAFDAGACSFPLPGGEKRVTLQLHYSTTADAVTLELPDGSSLRPYAHKRTLVAFGDSITHGSTAGRPSATYISCLGRLLDAEVYNMGIGGERFEDWKIVPGTYPKADIVTVAYGTNDYGHKAYCGKLFRKKLPVFFRKLHAQFPESKIFVLLPLWRLDEEKPHNDIPTLQTVRDAICEEIRQYPNMEAVDCQDFIPHEQKHFADARLHPNNGGMKLYADAVYEAIRGKV